MMFLILETPLEQTLEIPLELPLESRLTTLIDTLTQTLVRFESAIDELINPTPVEIEQGVSDQILLSGFLPNDGQVKMLVEFNPNQLVSFQELQRLQGTWQHQETGEQFTVLGIDYLSPEQSQGYDW